MTTIKLYEGNCLDVLRKCPDNYVDSIVTDPPYGLSFMGKAWDYQVPSVEIWKEALRVLKPGGHLLAFGGTRTYHRLVVAIEDAGFEIRDQIQWLYGQGFPKSMDISKAIDKEAGAEREVIGYENPYADGKIRKATGNIKGANDNVEFAGEYKLENGLRPVMAPATDAAKQWSGWGTALKPANEPICLARKPLSEKTVAKNVLKHGTGGLNIDAGRITVSEDDPNHGKPSVCYTGGSGAIPNGKSKGRPVENLNMSGRFPSNVILDESAAAVLDEQSGVLKTNAMSATHNKQPQTSMFKAGTHITKPNLVSDSGGASRFFQVIKQDTQCNANTVRLNSNQRKELDDFVVKLAAISERPGTPLRPTLKVFTQEIQNELKSDSGPSIETIQNIVQRFSRELWHIGMSLNSPADSAAPQMLIDTMRTIQSLWMSNSFAEAVTSSTTLNETAPGVLDLTSKFLYQAKASKSDRNTGLEGSGIVNNHATVKPIKLMEYLIKLVTPEGGTVLDPFMGSGTTGVAAKNLGFGFRGIEMSPEYYKICNQRILGASEDAA